MTSLSPPQWMSLFPTFLFCYRKYQLSSLKVNRLLYSSPSRRYTIPHYNNNFNDQIIAACSNLPNDPNVHLVMCDNLLNSKGSDVMHDNKHIKKQHLDLFPTNLAEAIRRRSKKPPADSSSPRRNQLRLDRLESTILTVMPSGTFPVGTTVYENINNHNSSRDLTIRKSRYHNTEPPPLC